MILMFVLWGFALYFFMKPTTNKLLTPQESKSFNSECVLFNYFDTHDIWPLFVCWCFDDRVINYLVYR